MQRRSLLKLLTLTAAAQVPSSSALAEAAGLLHPEQEPPTPAAMGCNARVFVNQVGYLTAQQKVASVAGLPSSAAAFKVRRAGDGETIFHGQLSDPRQDSASGDVIRLADFSGLKAAGRYTIEAGGSASDPFVIGNDVYAAPLRIAMRAFYGQRCGCAVDLGNGYHHAACHMAGDYHPSSGKSGPVPNGGGWHDAGDYGRYVVNSGITCGTLLWAWELYPSALQSLDLGIPRSRSGMPDFLAEVLWNLNWMMQLQDEDGGVFHKQTSERFCGFVMPGKDTMPSEIIGTGSAPFKSTGATAGFAAVMAIAARCFAPYDSVLSKRMLENARRAWKWAIANPSVLFRNPPGVSTGEYGDPNTNDEFLWASAELWQTTAEEMYETAFLAGAQTRALVLRAPSWGDVAPLAYWTYALSGRPGRQDIRDAVREATVNEAKRLLQQSAQNGYGNTLAANEYVWGSNSVAANQSLLLAIANRLASDGAFETVALNNLHYLLGRNCHGVSFVTQVGVRPFQHPHHRPSAADNIAAPWPGLLSGGPNAKPADEVAKKLPKLPPMRMWVDDERAYSMNEIAINWNAPLVFLLAFASTLSSESA